MKGQKANFLHVMKENEVLIIYIYVYINKYIFFSIVLGEIMLELNKGCGMKSAVWESSLETALPLCSSCVLGAEQFS